MRFCLAADRNGRLAGLRAKIAAFGSVPAAAEQREALRGLYKAGKGAQAQKLARELGVSPYYPTVLAGRAIKAREPQTDPGRQKAIKWARAAAKGPVLAGGGSGSASGSSSPMLRMARARSAPSPTAARIADSGRGGKSTCSLWSTARSAATACAASVSSAFLRNTDRIVSRPPVAAAHHCHMDGDDPQQQHPRDSDDHR